jgi:ribose-phosphate pyrophosphokinase
MKKILFAIKGYEYLAEKVMACGDFEKGELDASVINASSLK